MKTTFVSSLNPLSFVSNPDPKDLTYYLSMTENSGFIQSHEAMVGQLPQLSKISFEEFEGRNLFDHPIFDDPQLNATWEYLPNCNFHLRMVATFEDVAYLSLFFGICYLNYRDFTVSYPHIHFSATRTEIENISKGYPSEKLTALFIPLQITKTKLKKWIDDNWENIEQDVQELPENTADYIPKNLKIGIEITNLRAKGKTFEEISEILYDKYPNDDRLADYGQIRNMYHRYINYVPKGVVGALALNSLKRNTK